MYVKNLIPHSSPFESQWSLLILRFEKAWYLVCEWLKQITNDLDVTFLVTELIV